MKFDLNQYIEIHRNSMDLDVPGDHVWANIEQTLQPEKKRRVGFYLKIAAAITLLLGIGYVVNILLGPGQSNENQLAVNAIPDSLRADSTDAYSFQHNLNPATIEEQETSTELIHNPVTEPSVAQNQQPLSQKENANYRVADGTIINAPGGTPPYTYHWGPEGGESPGSDKDGKVYYHNNGELQLVEGGTFTMGRTEQGLSNGTYTVVIDDEKNKDGWGYDQPTQGGFERVNTETYAPIVENDFITATTEPVSTFSIDVDGAAYSNMRRFINDGMLPPPDAVKIEEMINYFNYNYPQPEGPHPFSITTEYGQCPWNAKHQMVMIGLQGEKVEAEELPANNLVFLLDVSGSMEDADKLPLLKSAFKLLVKELREEDRVSIVVYAGAAGVVLPPTSGAHKDNILDALNNLNAGGSTAGGEGIELAYKMAEKHFMKKGNNRVILATDGDFNVGLSDDDGLVKLIEEKRNKGVFLSVLGFGTGNYQDAKMEKIADNGNGNFSYIDNIMEAKKVLVTEMGGTLLTIAKDVKIQIEFNPSKVQAYRLIGYENRLLANRDFNDDTKDAGELGAGHTVTALYEIIPAGTNETVAEEPLKYQRTVLDDTYNNEILTVKFRYKKPNGHKSRLIKKSLQTTQIHPVSNNFKFATSVAEFGLLLRNSKYKGNAGFQQLLQRAKHAKGKDIEGYRSEFVKLVETVSLMQND